jgi:hypothetical protein
MTLKVAAVLDATQLAEAGCVLIFGMYVRAFSKAMQIFENEDKFIPTAVADLMH